jgi:DNA-binding response OmpR family regulator
VHTPKTILVVEDDAALAVLIEESLQREGFLVLSVGNGVECLEMVSSQPVDLVILDLMMPLMGGMEALRLLRHEPKTQLLPVIIFTGQSDHATVVTGWMSGAERYLTKPLRMDTLVREVKQLLSPPVGQPDPLGPAPSSEP